MKKYLRAKGFTREMEIFRSSYSRWEREGRELDIFEDAKYINEKVYKQYQNYMRLINDEAYMEKLNKKVNKELEPFIEPRLEINEKNMKKYEKRIKKYKRNV